MTAATVELYVENAIPSMEVVRLTASDGNTYSSRKFKVVTAAIICLNEDTDAYANVTNSAGTTIDGTTRNLKLNIAGASNQTCTLIMFGHK